MTKNPITHVNSNDDPCRYFHLGKIREIVRKVSSQDFQWRMSNNFAFCGNRNFLRFFCGLKHALRQSRYREVPRWEIFMEQELRFGLDSGRLALLKKKRFGPIMSNFLGRFFFLIFNGKKNRRILFLG